VQYIGDTISENCFLSKSHRPGAPLYGVPTLEMGIEDDFGNGQNATGLQGIKRLFGRRFTIRDFPRTVISNIQSN
jgi:hypothetical protein